MIPLRTTVQSFDLFDTLITRTCITPANLFAEVGVALGMSDFASARIAAERRVFARTDSFDLTDIYRELTKSGYCEESSARLLMAAEIEAEFDNATPIVENLTCVREFDLVVSDMYLPAAILRSLLQHVGLRCFVHLFVSNAGKFRGTIWPLLTERWLIVRHIGDHEHADVIQPRRFGIAANWYNESACSGVEIYLDAEGMPLLARIARRMRLANPYRRGTPEAELWNSYAQFNFPLLCLAAAEARKQREAVGQEKIFFLARDCHFLSEIFGSIYPEEPIELIQVSRGALARNPDEFADYLASRGVGQALLFDLVSTGYSWLCFSRMMAIPINFFALTYIDNYQYEPFDAAELVGNESFKFGYAVRTSEISNWSLAMEILNTAPHGSTVELEKLGDYYVPRFEDRHELPPSLLNSLIHAQAAAVDCLRSQRGSISLELAQISEAHGVFSTLIGALSSNEWLNQLATLSICKPMN